MNSVNIYLNTLKDSTNTIRNTDCKDEQTLENITNKNNEQINNNIEKTSNEVKVKNETVIKYENIFSLKKIGNVCNNTLTNLKEFYTILKEYYNNKKNENNEKSHYFNSKEPLLHFDELDLIINDINTFDNNNNSKELENCYDDKSKIITVNSNDGSNINYNIDNNSLINNDNIEIKQVKLATFSQYQQLSPNIDPKSGEVLESKIHDVKNIPPITEEHNTPKDTNNFEDIKKAEKNIPIEGDEDSINNTIIHTETIIIDNTHITKESENFDKTYLIPVTDNNDVIKAYTESSTQPNSNDKVDTISISSDEDIIEIDDSDSDDYHSSDFEFIDEHEAKKTGYIINYNASANIFANNKVKTIELDKHLSQNLIYDYFYTPLSEPNGGNEGHHEVPQGDDYLDLFGGNFTPLPTRSMQNKATNAGLCMNVGLNGIGFDMRQLHENPELDAYKEEAVKSEEKILNLYPVENRSKRRRRY